MRSIMYCLADDDLADLGHEVVDERAFLGDDFVQRSNVLHEYFLAGARRIARLAPPRQMDARAVFPAGHHEMTEESAGSRAYGVKARLSTASSNAPGSGT